MSVLGELLDTDPQDSPLTAIRERLQDGRRAGLSFDRAWELAVRHAQHTTTLHLWAKPSEGQSPLDFARPRMERAYQGLDPSIPHCQHPDCPYDAARGKLCLLHAPIPGEVRTA